MATEKKKTTTKTKSPVKASSSKGSRTKKREKADIAFYRGLWAALYLFLAFLACLSACSVGGFLIKGYDWLFRTLVGYGSAILPFVFMSAGLILLIKRKKGKARFKVAALLVLPVVVGAIRQVTLRACDWKEFGNLGATGRELASGGFIGGFFADLLNSALSRVGALILLYLLIVAALAVAFSELIIRAIDTVRNMRPEREDDPIPARPAERTPAVAVTKRRSIDVYEEDPEKKPAQKSGKSFLDMSDITRSSDKTGDKSAERYDPTAPRTPRFETVDAVFTAPAKTEEEKTPEVSFKPEEPVKPAEPVIPVKTLKQDAKKTAEEVKKQNDAVAKQIEAALGGDAEVKYMYPPISLLNEGTGARKGSAEAIKSCGERLMDTLQSFGVEATLVDVTAGPTVTRFEIQLQRGVKVSKVENLSVEIALALGAQGVRISTIPDKNAIGIEIPNEVSETVAIRDIVGSQAFRDSSSKLSFAVGKDIGGDCVIGDIAKMPHMLIAGTTGSGKSVCINSILISLLYKATPEEVRLIMVDPKMIELKVYNGIPHLLIPVVTDPKKAAGALNWAVGEMMKRYQLFSEAGTRDLRSYNAEMKKREGGQTLPQVVIVIDELSDLMTVAKNEVEEAIIRIAQMARAAGMHLIVATQRPSADVITGLIKANVPSRVAFAVSSQIESRIILDQQGAEKLIGRGDMLYSPLGGGKPRRVQGCFVSDSEVEKVVEFIKNNGGTADYNDEIIKHIENHGNKEAAAAAGAAGAVDSGDDEMLDAAIDVVMESGQASTSMLQRRLKLGYARAARIMDMMEEKGIIGEYEGSKPRQILITRDQWNEMKLRKKENE